MGATVRQASAADSALWLDLFRASVGEDYPDKQVYETDWIASQLDASSGHETWVVEENYAFQASICFLAPSPASNNPVANLGRCLFRPESFKNGAAESLLLKINEIAEERKQLVVCRVPADDNPQQILFENLGFTCAGYQPFKHLHRVRHGCLFYIWFARPDVVNRFPISESLSQVSELAATVLGNLTIPNPVSVRDGVTGYPLKSEVLVHDSSYDDFDLWRLQAENMNPPREVSTGYNLGQGLMRASNSQPARAVLAQRDANFVAGMAFSFDEVDRCLRIVDSFATDDISIGALLNHIVKVAQEQFGAVYVEVDVVMTAPRMLKTAEQLGFSPVAYLPAFFNHAGRCADVVKLVKLNMIYSLEGISLTTHARVVVDIVDRSFQDQKVGVAVINMLRGLPIFAGLGDGELRKMARLFTQKLFRPAERIFNKGDGGNEAYVVMRGQIDIFLEEDAAKPIASVGIGQIFGELAFLDGAARNAHAVATQASILLVVQRIAFNELVQREPHLGMVVMRNIALELSGRLRKTNTAVSAATRRQLG
ncbi:MAG TPA: cyclic nucleotide-binding domain-containing protein [Verrucomicrobiae bacterium]|nr:cyclic nucleotide-binding domain-containing protein [Verrucomicrobiae bacterium]